MFPADVVEVAIASTDGDRFRTAIRDGLHRWNSGSAERRQILVMPTTARDQCDVVIAVFASGRRTADDVLRDVVRAKASGKAVHAWVVAESPWQDQTASHQAWLSDVEQRLAKECIAPRYIGSAETDLDARIHTAITEVLAEFDVQAPRVTIYRTPVPLLRPDIWAVTVANHGNAIVTDVKVRVDALDSEGNDLPHAARRSQQELADVFAKLRNGQWPRVHGRGATSAVQNSTFPGTRMDVLAAHTALRFPRWLRPAQRASALYEVDVDASLRVHVHFEDQAGQAWSGTDDAESQRVPAASNRAWQRDDIRSDESKAYGPGRR